MIEIREMETFCSLKRTFREQFFVYEIVQGFVNDPNYA